MALGRAIDVNAAYRAVKDPVKRAEALLARAGLDVGETSEPKAPPALLMEMMEAREELSEAAAEAKLERCGRRASAPECANDKRRSSATSSSGFGAAEGDKKRLTELFPKLGELRYVRRFLDEVGAIEERLSP